MVALELRPIVGFPGYAVSNDRVVYSFRAGEWRALKPFDKGPLRGGFAVSLCRQGRTYQRYVRALYRDAWGEGSMVNGKRPSGIVKGSKHGRARLTEEKVVEARRLHRDGWITERLAERYGVAPHTMGYCLAGKTWRHVPMPVASPTSVP